MWNSSRVPCWTSCVEHVPALLKFYLCLTKHPGEQEEVFYEFQELEQNKVKFGPYLWNKVCNNHA